MKDRIHRDLITSIHSCDEVSIRALSSLEATIEEAQNNSNGKLTDDNISKIILKQIKQLQDNIAKHIDEGKRDLATTETLEVSVLKKYAPYVLDVAETEEAVSDAIYMTCATSVNDINRIMTYLKNRYFIASKKLILYLVFMLIEGIFSLPMLNGANRLLGGCIGLLSGIVLIYILCGVLSLNVSNSVEIREIIDKTYIVKYFYDYNILMNLFVKK